MKMLSAERRTWLRVQASRYSDALDDANPDVLEWLMGPERGLLYSTVAGALLGVVTEPEAEHRNYLNRISIPYITPGGVVGFRFRCHASVFEEGHKCDEHAKYLSVTGQPITMYNVQALHDAEDVIAICEGEFDALMATQSGLPAVAIPGIRAWRPHWYRLFEGFSEVIILGDADKAGGEMATRLTEDIEHARACELPAGEDVTSFVIAKGPEEFLRWVL